MKVHAYRNRSDDVSPRERRHFCRACRGWYGVPHEDSHCQTGDIATWQPQMCACRFCKEHTSQPVEGAYGFFTDAPEWQP